jgi:hypothetical protein
VINLEKEISEGEQRFNEFWNGVYAPNKSPKCKKLKNKLEENGHTNVFVWYERLGSAMEMCGPSGGYMYVSDQSSLEPIGYSFDEALEIINNEWHKV